MHPKTKGAHPSTVKSFQTRTTLEMLTAHIMLGQQDPECRPQVRDRELVSLQIIGKDEKGEGEGAGKGILSLWTF